MFDTFWQKLKLIFVLFCLSLYSSFSLASLNYHGRIINENNNQPLTSSDIRFNIKIKAGATCVVYEENHDAIDMSSTNGYFNLNIGEGSSVFGSFANAMKIDGSTVGCDDSSSISMTSVISKSIDVHILENSGMSYSTNIAQIVGIQIKDVPVSVSARNLEGKTANQFIQVSGSVTQISLADLTAGTSTLYVQSANLGTDVAPYISGKMDKSSNLSDVANTTTARTNLGLGAIATQNTIGDSYISALAYSKLTGVPSTFTPSSHTHSISDVTGLQAALDNKITGTQLSLNCTAAQTIQYISISDSYQCQSISITNTQVSGLGSLATASSVGDSSITALSGSKLTGPIAIGTVAGTSCSSIGLFRYDSGNLQVCNGSIWTTVGSTNASNDLIIGQLKGTFDATTANSILNFSTTDIDTQTRFTSFQYSIPKSGRYFLSGFIGSSAVIAFNIFVNGVDTGETLLFTDTNGRGSGSQMFSFTQNQLISLRPKSNVAAGSGYSRFSIQYIDNNGGASSITSTDVTTALGYSPVRPSNNLSDLSNITTARTNLGLGSIAILNTISDTNITSLAGSKLTGGIQFGTVSGSSCSSAGLVRYNSGSLELCNGSIWTAVSSSSGTPILAAATGNPASATSGNPIIFPTKYIDTTTSLYNATTGKFSIPSDGYYKLTAALDGAPSTGLTFYMYINNVLQLEMGAISSSAIGHTVSGVNYFTAGQTVDIRPNATYDGTGGNIIFEKIQAPAGASAIGDVSGLQTALDLKLTASKLSLNCTAAQTVQYISVSDSYQCQSIAISDSNISSLAGSKLTGGVQIGTVSGTSCTSAGLARYNSGVVEFCNGSTWSSLSSTNGIVPILSGWTAYTLPITATTTNPTKGTVTRDKAYWRRVGDTMEIMYSYEQSAGSGAGSGTYIFGLPSGYTIDTALSVAGVAQQGVVGHFAANGGSQFTQIWGEVKIHNTTGFSLHGSNEASRYIVSSGSGDLGQASIKYSFFARVPIVGWAATTNTVVAYVAPVKAKYRTSATQTINAGETIINFNTVETDSTGSLVTTGAAWRFTASTAGLYSVKTFIHTASSQASYINLYKMNSFVERIGQQPAATSSGCSGNTDIQLAAGEWIDVRLSVVSATTLIGNSSLNWISIVRVSE